MPANPHGYWLAAVIRLKPGSYTVDAERGGVRKGKRMEVKANALVRERFFWIVDASLTPR